MILKLDLIAYLWDFQGGWYQWADSNRHDSRHRILNPACLPFHHTGISCEEDGIIGTLCLKLCKTHLTNRNFTFADNREWNFYCLVDHKLVQKDLT